MKLINLFVTLVCIISLLSCARRGNPTGGLKDLEAPITIKTIPEFNAVNFNQKEIIIYFDEYIKLNKLDENLIVSPPLKYPADITPLGLPSKKVIIKIKDTLLQNTTYTFNFGESIIDNNEGNVLKGFKYIFSTGKHIDSLSIKGTISSALSKKADKYVSVLLYEDNKEFNDSTIYKTKPLYVTNTLDSIGWEIGNLKKGKYHLVAIKEDSKDFLFNPKTDKIAYYDSIITIPTEREFNLKLFKEILDFKTFKPIEVSKGHVLVGFQGISDDLEINADVHKSGIDFISSKSYIEKERDSLHFHFTSDKPIDSLLLNIKNGKFQTEEKVKLRSSLIDSLKITSNIRGTLHFRDTLKLSMNNPLDTFDEKLFSMYDKDTVAVDFTLKRDNHLDLMVLFDKKETQNYKLQILPNAITDFYKQNNKDTLNYTFRTKKKDNYGSISLKVNNSKKKHVLVQLLSTKEELISEEKNVIGKVSFELLMPSKYLIRVIVDSNNNGKWDTGNYLKKQQPEKVIYFNGEIEVKENWFVNEVIDIK